MTEAFDFTRGLFPVALVIQGYQEAMLQGEVNIILHQQLRLEKAHCITQYHSIQHG